MPGNIRPTHTLSATGESTVSCADDEGCPGNTTCDPDKGVCVDTYGTPIEKPGADIIGGTTGDPIPVRFHPQGANIGLEFIRSSAGESIQRSPIIEAPGTIAPDLEEGNTLSLTALADGYDDYGNLEARAVAEVYGPQRSRPTKTIIETEEM